MSAATSTPNGVKAACSTEDEGTLTEHRSPSQVELCCDCCGARCVPTVSAAVLVDTVVIQLTSGAELRARPYGHSVSGRHILLVQAGLLWKAARSAREKHFYETILALSTHRSHLRAMSEEKAKGSRAASHTTPHSISSEEVEEAKKRDACATKAETASLLVPFLPRYYGTRSVACLKVDPDRVCGVGTLSPSPSLSPSTSMVVVTQPSSSSFPKETVSTTAGNGSSHNGHSGTAAAEADDGVTIAADTSPRVVREGGVRRSPAKVNGNVSSPSRAQGHVEEEEKGEASIAGNALQPPPPLSVQHRDTTQQTSSQPSATSHEEAENEAAADDEDAHAERCGCDGSVSHSTPITTTTTTIASPSPSVEEQQRRQQHVVVERLIAKFNSDQREIKEDRLKRERARREKQRHAAEENEGAHHHVSASSMTAGDASVSAGAIDNESDGEKGGVEDEQEGGEECVEDDEVAPENEDESSAQTSAPHNNNNSTNGEGEERVTSYPMDLTTAVFTDGSAHLSFALGRSATSDGALPMMPTKGQLDEVLNRKLPSHSPHTDAVEMLVIEDICYKYIHPCVLDVKMGSRQYGLHASAEKKRSKDVKAANSTSATYGFRLAGFKRWNDALQCFETRSKAELKALSIDEVRDTVLHFLSARCHHTSHENDSFAYSGSAAVPPSPSHVTRDDEVTTGEARGGDDGDETSDTAVAARLRACVASKIAQLLGVFERQTLFRFYTSSLLVCYDAARPVESCRVVMIDFAYTYEIAEVRAAKDEDGSSVLDEDYIHALRSLLKTVV